MRKYGAWSEQENTKFRTSGDNKEVTLTPPSSLTGASNTFTTPNISGTTDTIISRVSSDTGANRLQSKDLSADNVSFVDNTDVTKKLLFGISGFTTATTNTITIPDSSDTMVLAAETQTLTNKTIDGDDNTIQDLALSTLKTSGNLNVFLQRDGSGNVIDSAQSVPTGDVVGTSDTQTLSNKTFTLPQINDTSADHQYIFAVNELTLDRTVTLPLLTGNDTFVFADHAETLTNKTIDADSNTITNIENADIKAGAVIDATKIHDGSVDNTEFGYLNGVTSAIQTQIDGKQDDVITTRGDVIYGNVSGVATRLPIGASGTVLTSDGTDVSWTTPAGTGDVTSAAVITDNAIVRGDGGAKGVQDTGVFINDSNEMTGLAGLTATGDIISNTNVFVVNSVDSNVGIGTAAPTSSSKLTIGDSDTLTSAQLVINQASTGDASLSMIADSQTWTVGLDNSDSNSFKIAPNADAGTSTALVIDTSNNFTFNSLTNITSTGRVQVGAGGTVAAPGLSSASDTNTGIVWGNDDTLRVVTAGAERARITAGGDVGIGIDSPDTIFHIRDSAPYLKIDNVATDATAKQGRIVTGHYTNAEQDIFMLGAVSNGTNNTVHLGGSSSVHNASTNVIIWAAANDTTLAGTQQMEVTSDGVSIKNALNYERSDVTISGGAITVNGSYVRVDTEASAATDDLDTINGGVVGDVLILASANDGRDPTAKDGTGNLRIAGDFTFSNTNYTLTLIFNGTNWIEVSRSAN